MRRGCSQRKATSNRYGRQHVYWRSAHVNAMIGDWVGTREGWRPFIPRFSPLLPVTRAIKPRSQRKNWMTIVTEDLDLHTHL